MQYDEKLGTQLHLKTKCKKLGFFAQTYNNK